MPTGVIIDVTAVVLGSLTGKILGSRMSGSLKDTLNSILGLSGICMGVCTIVLMKNLPAVIFSIIVGTLLGLALKLGIGIEKGCSLVLNKVMQDADQEASGMMLTAVVLFCTGSAGIYGALDAGMTGNHSMLVTKGVLDFFTSMIFACKLGMSVSFIGVPQFAILFGMFSLAQVILPLTTDAMIADFKAVGGIVLLASGLRIMKIKDFPVADMSMAMVIIMPVSYFWTTCLLPLIT